jgi:hypothetical protein
MAVRSASTMPPALARIVPILHIAMRAIEKESVSRRHSGVPVEGIDVAVYRVPTDLSEADGTLPWDATTMVLVRAPCERSHRSGIHLRRREHG